MVDALDGTNPIDTKGDGKTTTTMLQVKLLQTLNSFKIMLVVVDFEKKIVVPCRINPIPQSILQTSISTSKLANTLHKAIKQYIVK